MRHSRRSSSHALQSASDFGAERRRGCALAPEVIVDDTAHCEAMAGLDIYLQTCGAPALQKSIDLRLAFTDDDRPTLAPRQQ